MGSLSRKAWQAGQQRLLRCDCVLVPSVILPFLAASLFLGFGVGFANQVVPLYLSEVSRAMAIHSVQPVKGCPGNQGSPVASLKHGTW